MITIDMIDEYVSENQKPAAHRQSHRSLSIRRMLSAVLGLLFEPEADGLRSMRPVDDTLVKVHLAKLYWSRG